MALDTHTVEIPKWVGALVDLIAEAVEPLGFIGPLGYRAWEPGNTRNEFDGWLLVVFPTPNEVSGGPHDGAKYVSGFRLDVSRLQACFSEVEQVAWNAPVRYNGDLDGPEFSLQGRCFGRRIWLRVFNLPPPDEPVSFRVNIATGEAWEKAPE